MKTKKFKKIITADNITYAVANTLKYLSKCGHGTSGVDLKKCIETPGHWEPFYSPAGEAHVGYISKNTFEIDIYNFER